jgi:hypothetical protein
VAQRHFLRCRFFDDDFVKDQTVASVPAPDHGDLVGAMRQAHLGKCDEGSARVENFRHATRLTSCITSSTSAAWGKQASTKAHNSGS